ncbi:MAG: peptidoglycan DD-metalloendopeptidase family protein [Patescibacteria group bacterium]
MNISINRYIGFLMAFAILIANANFVFADNELSKPDSFSFSSGFEEETAANTATKTEPSTGTDSSTDKIKQNEEFLNRLKQELNLSKTDYRQLLNNLEETEKRLEQVQNDKFTLNTQLSNLDNQITETTKKLITAISQVVEKENAISLLYEEIEIREVAMGVQKNLLRDYFRTMYEEGNIFFSIDENGEVDAFKLLLADGTIGNNLRQLDYLDLLSVTGQQMVDKLDKISKELENKKTELEGEKVKLDEFQTILSKERDQLNLQKESKGKLLKVTSGQEQIYEQLIAKSIEDQEETVDDIRSLSGAVGFIEQKIREEGADFNPDKYKSILDEKTTALYKFQLENLGENVGQFIWPVEPIKGISAYFRDPSYAVSFGIQHNAVDIPIYQGSPIRSAADGVVYTAKDGGYGYSYIIVAHADGFSTIYGHVSQILVKEGQFVSKGSIIALSGGMPGTKGSGYLTTGPHLHFEILKNGVYTDPLNYLSLDILTPEEIEALPEKYKGRWDEAVLRSSEDF